MKSLIYALAITGIIVGLGYSCSDGFDKEVKRQCIVAMDHCEKYSDAGACNPEYLKVCEGVKDYE